MDHLDDRAARKLNYRYPHYKRISTHSIDVLASDQYNLKKNINNTEEGFISDTTGNKSAETKTSDIDCESDRFDDRHTDVFLRNREKFEKEIQKTKNHYKRAMSASTSQLWNGAVMNGHLEGTSGLRNGGYGYRRRGSMDALSSNQKYNYVDSNGDFDSDASTVVSEGPLRLPSVKQLASKFDPKNYGNNFYSLPRRNTQVNLRVYNFL